MPFDEREAMATHYNDNGIQPSHKVLLGFVVGQNFFETLYISIHKKEAERRGLKEYKP